MGALTRRSTLVTGTVVAATMLLGPGVAPGPVRAEDAPDVRQAGCHESGRYEVCTTSPERYADGVDRTIVDRLRDYVQAATRVGDGAIHGTMYLWELYLRDADGRHDPEHPENVAEIEGLVDDLVAAHRAGVEVRMVIGDDDGRNADAIERLTAGGVDVTFCATSCLPNGDGIRRGVMHLKFFTFAVAGEHRVVHSSSNLSRGQLRRHQNLLSVTGDRALYDNYVGFWHRIASGSWTHQGETWGGRDRARLGDTPGTKSYFFPRPAADPVRGTLEKLECSMGHARVWVAASLFYTDERLPVLRVLDDLAAAGCDVRVIVARASDYDWVTGNSGLDSVRLLDGAGAVWSSQHNKLLVTDAVYEGDDVRPAVYAGSHNLNRNSLRNSSDGMLRIVDKGAFDAYAAYYEQMYALAR